MTHKRTSLLLFSIQTCLCVHIQRISENRGYFYPALKADVHKYVKPSSEKLKVWLKKLREEGKKLFLITNSQADFSMFVLENAFG